jgi:hypothetical protein
MAKQSALKKESDSSTKSRPKVEYLGCVTPSFLVRIADPSVVGVIDMQKGPKAIAWKISDAAMEGRDYEEGSPYGPYRLLLFGGENGDDARRHFIGNVLRNGTVWRKRLTVIVCRGEKSFDEKAS